MPYLSNCSYKALYLSPSYFRLTWLDLFTIVLALILIVLSVFDIKTFRLPNFLTISLTVAGLYLNYYFGGGAVAVVTSFFGCILGFSSLWAVAAIYRGVRGKPGLGLGDAKLFAAAGAWLGPLYLTPLMAAASLTALGFVAIRAGIHGRQTTSHIVPFGPFIAGAFFALWCVKTYAEG